MVPLPSTNGLAGLHGWFVYLAIMVSGQWHHRSLPLEPTVPAFGTDSANGADYEFQRCGLSVPHLETNWN